MFRRIDCGADTIEIVVDDETLPVPAGMTVAAALLLHDKVPTRLNQATAAPRAPHCLMGACFECLLEIDGIEQRACQVGVASGMRIHRRLQSLPEDKPE